MFSQLLSNVAFSDKHKKLNNKLNDESKCLTIQCVSDINDGQNINQYSNKSTQYFHKSYVAVNDVSHRAGDKLSSELCCATVCTISISG